MPYFASQINRSISSMNLVIVESPAKAKTIEGFLGKDFTVKSSFGHVRDLAKKALGIDVTKNFTPQYEPMPDKKELIKELKKMSDKAELVWLATDEDREGEAISWHLAEVLKLKEEKTKRIVFNEITKTAIQKAIQNPRTIDYNLVNAQQARRVLDRLVGFELSPVLWKKVKPSLSAGRVQSVAVRLIVEREREIQNFKVETFYKIGAEFLNAKKQVVRAEVPHKIKDSAQTQQLLQSFSQARFNVESVETKPSKRGPSAPFTTSTLQQEASRKLGFSVAKTMLVAQHLYESGKITYMRTDSVNLSETAIEAAQQEIKKLFGEKYSYPRKFQTKSKGAQEAHEAIRPTYMNLQTIEGDYDEQRLYDLIWKRTLASQMAEALIDKTTILIKNDQNKEDFQATGEVIAFDGFMKVYMESDDLEEEEEGAESRLPLLQKGEALDYAWMKGTQRFTHHLPRYTEASLVKKLEENGIGRPSTYAPTISTIQKREYVVKESREGNPRKYEILTLEKGKISQEIKSEQTGAEKNKLFPTDIGMVVNDFLVQNFEKIMDYQFTAKVEKEFDDIANGDVVWHKMIADFYKPFHQTVEHAVEHSDTAKGERLLGTDPSSKKPVYVKIGKYGPLVQLGETESEEKPKFASLLKGMSISSVTLEESLFLLQLPLVVGKYKNEVIELNNGRFGPYVKFLDKFYSLPAQTDFFNVSEALAIQVIDEKDQRDLNKNIKEFAENKELKVLNGRWGPYITFEKKNYKIPKGKVAADLSLAECMEIIQSQGDKKPARGKKKSTK